MIPGMMPPESLNLISGDILSVRANETEKSGKCGDSVSWSLDSNGRLTISGKGKIYDYDFDSYDEEKHTPWYKYNDSIKELIIEEGIEYIGDYAFYDCQKLKNISLPDSVKEIGKMSFANCSDISEIIFPENLSCIGEYAFYQCMNLENFAFPDSVKKIGDFAFQGCSRLTELNISANVETIGANIVLYSISLENITVSEKNKYFCAVDGVLLSKDKTKLYAYPGRKSQESYTVPDSVCVIGSSAFYSLKLSTINIGSKVKEISNDSFNSCNNLQNINVSKDNNYFSDIDGNLYNKDKTEFYKYTIGKKETSFKVPDGTENICSGAFILTNLTEISLPDSIKKIDDIAFKNNSSLKEIVIHDGCKEIGAKAFLNNIAMEKIVIPESVEKIGDYAFFNCKALTIYGYEGSFAESYAKAEGIPFVAIGADDNISGDTQSENSDDKDTGEKDEKDENIVSSGVCGENVKWVLDKDGTITFSGKGEMYDYLGYDSVPWRDWDDSIVKVVFNDGVESIGDYVFYSFHALKEISISKTVKSIGEYSFYWCTSLKEISIPSGVECIKKDAFGLCSALKNIEISESVTDIRNNVFEKTLWMDKYYAENENQFLIINGNLLDCNQAEGEIIIPDGVVNIADYVFNSKRQLTSVYIPDSVKKIGNNSFNGCTNLSEIHFSENLESIGRSAFEGTAWFENKKSEDEFVIVNGFLLYGNSCKGDVVIPDNVKYIADNAFYRCSNINSVTIPDCVKYIGDSAFFQCNSIKSISLPKELTYIGSYAFANCFGINEISIPENVKYIGEYAFFQCTGLKSISLPDSLEEIDDYAFSLCTNLRELTIPKNVSKIGTNIVLKNRYMERIGVSEENKSYCEVDGVLFNSKKTHLLAYPGNKADKTYTIPDGVTDIRSEAFSSTLLEEVIIPESVEYIWKEAFKISSYLKNIKVAEDNKAYSDIDGVLCDKDKKTLISYSVGREDKAYKIPEGIEKIEKYAFFTSCLEKITLPDSLKSIINYGFANCYKLKEIEIPDGCTLISGLAFLNCDALNKIVIPRSVSNIGNDSFSSCNKLVIYGYKDSYAEKYASENIIPFIDIETVEPEDKIHGDLSDDGIVGAQDLVLLTDILLSMDDELSDEKLEAADMNNDGKVNVIDLIYLKQLLLG